MDIFKTQKDFEKIFKERIDKILSSKGNIDMTNIISDLIFEIYGRDIGYFKALEAISNLNIDYEKNEKELKEYIAKIDNEKNEKELKEYITKTKTI
jgi:ribosomal protein S18